MKRTKLILDYQRFRYGWRLIVEVWNKNRHCLQYGCGRETLQYWVIKTCHKILPAWFLRAVLMEAVQLGWATKSYSPCGYSIFIIKR